MKDKKSVVACSQKDVDRFINICNNLFYNDYLNTGVLQSNHEIVKRIKKDACESLVNFYGEEYQKKIQQIIDKIDMNFVYQVFGPICAVDSFMENHEGNRVMKFAEKYGSVVAFQCLFNVLKDAEKKALPIDEVVNQNYVLFHDCHKILLANVDRTNLKQQALLKFELKEILGNKNLLNQFLDLIKQQINLIESRKVTLHDNPHVNKNLEFVASFIQQTKANLNHQCLQHKKSLSDVTMKSNAGISLDPVVQRLYPAYAGKAKRDNGDQAFSMLFLENMLRPSASNGSAIFGYYDEDKVFFTNNLTDDTIIHELIHAVEQGGFLKDQKVKTTDQYDKYEMLNEVITEYFADSIMQERNKQDKKPIVNRADTPATYRALFQIMDSFLSAYLPELKAIRMGENPVEDFQQIIGEVQFEKMAEYCNAYFELLHSKNICDEANRMCMSVSSYLIEANEKLTYQPQTADIDHLEDLIAVELNKVKLNLGLLANKVAMQKSKDHHKKQNLFSNFNNSMLRVEAKKELVPELEYAR